MTPEHERLRQADTRDANWQRWGPYLAERQWGTVREDYSENHDSWNYFSHDDARARAYRWGEDGLLGITDRECRLCFALALWNGRDPFLKERLFGLTNPQGNHGEDVKECYFFLDSTPTHSYMHALYKYPQQEFPYRQLLEENARRGRNEREYELLDTGIFDDNRYFDVFLEYAKAGPNDILIRITAANRAAVEADLHLLPQLWFRNSWAWGCSYDGCERRPAMRLRGSHDVDCHHATLQRFAFSASDGPDARAPQWLFTENETNARKLWGAPNKSTYTRDAFHERVVHGRMECVNPQQQGTKAAAWYRLNFAPGQTHVITMRLTEGKTPAPASGDEFDAIFAARQQEADAFYETVLPAAATPEERLIARQAYAGLLWSKQYYHYVIDSWLDGDPDQPVPPASRKQGPNANWRHLFNRDVISMPDTWEYPWYAAWDLAFHMPTMSHVDPAFARDQLLLFLREWYMHPNGQLPAYEYTFDDVNPPVHAWACWRVYKIARKNGMRDLDFLKRSFVKLIMNFTWWVNRKDPHGRNIFAGGFLGLDNIGVFDRSKPLPDGGNLEQADATAWMATYCSTMLGMALELALEDDIYEDIASKFFEHFVAIADAMNTLGGTGLWDHEDGFYYDQVFNDHGAHPLKVRSLVGIIPLLAVEVLDEETIERLPNFKKRAEWFMRHKPDLARHFSYAGDEESGCLSHGHRLLAIPTRDRLERILRYILDEDEFFGPYGIRSLSKFHEVQPYTYYTSDGTAHTVKYLPGESDSGLFGGNSNWRGPVWFPINYLLVEALERYHHFYGDTLKVECPTNSGNMRTLQEAADEIADRLNKIFLPDVSGRRPVHSEEHRYADDPHWRDLVLFYEYFDGDTGRGCGASHQTGWTALVARTLRQIARAREKKSSATD